jgi:hypothetical protein
VQHFGVRPRGQRTPSCRISRSVAGAAKADAASPTMDARESFILEFKCWNRGCLLAFRKFQAVRRVC